MRLGERAMSLLDRRQQGERVVVVTAAVELLLLLQLLVGVVRVRVGALTLG